MLTNYERTRHSHLTRISLSFEMKYSKNSKLDLTQNDYFSLGFLQRVEKFECWQTGAIEDTAECGYWWARHKLLSSGHEYIFRGEFSSLLWDVYFNRVFLSRNYWLIVALRKFLKQLFARSRWFEGKRDSFKKIKIPRGNCLFALSPLVYRKISWTVLSIRFSLDGHLDPVDEHYRVTWPI